MNEHLSPQSPEINRQSKEALVQKVREIAPYENQPVDRLGCYATHFDQGDSYVSIYIPRSVGQDKENEFKDDAVRVIERETIEALGRYTAVRMKHYRIHLDDFDASYSEDIKIFDEETGRVLADNSVPTVENIIRNYMLHKSYEGSSHFSEERLHEVNAILESLDPASKFHY